MFAVLVEAGCPSERKAKPITGQEETYHRVTNQTGQPTSNDSLSAGVPETNHTFSCITTKNLIFLVSHEVRKKLTLLQPKNKVYESVSNQ